MTTELWAVVLALVVAIALLVVYLLALRDMRREVKRLEKMFPLGSGEQGNSEGDRPDDS